jgi:enterochelin esterase-like enzyme
MALLVAVLELPQSVESTASDPKTDADGVVHITITSSAQSKPVEVRILAPGALPVGEERRFLYVLPVEKEGDSRYGDGLAEARRLGLHEKHGMVVVAPGFAELPWYADHPTNPKRRDESHLLEAVLPLVEKRYPSKKPRRFLLGFSKSGWGAWSLLLRHPEVFDAAAAWDAPLMKEKPDMFGMDGAFVTQQNFEGYWLTKLLREKAEALGGRKRLAHFGYGNFRDDHQRMQALLEELKIPVVYKDGPQRKHVWESGWVGEAAEALQALGR